MECERDSSLFEKRIYGVFSGSRCRYFLFTGNKMQCGTSGIGFERLSSVLELCGKKGYSGTAIFTKKEPLSVSYGLGIEEHDQEGRVICLEFEDFYMVTVYTPNSKNELERLDYRMIWEDEFRKYLSKLNEKKPVVVCGDMNVAHEEIDLKNPKTNRRNAGFTDEERNKFTELLQAGFTDSFRYLYPNTLHAYSWWSYRANARKNNTGWRIDYFVVSNDWKEQIQEAEIHAEQEGSDHCPVALYLK